MGKSAVAAAPANVARISWVGNHEALVAAVDRIGGAATLVRRTSLTRQEVNDILDDGQLVDPDLCPEIERATKVRCEDLRADLIWHRDGAGEVIGYTSPVQSHPRSAVVGLIASKQSQGALVDGQWDPLSYRAGMLHGVSPEYQAELLGDVYDNRDWTDHETLESFQADINDWHCTGAYFECFGMLHDLDEKTRERLLKECGVGKTMDWNQGKVDEMWAKAQAIRAAEPHSSSVAGMAFAAGIASMLVKYGKGDDFRDFHGMGKKEAWDADDFRLMADHALTIVLDAALEGRKRNWSSWENILVGQTSHVRSQIGSETAERVGKTAGNLLDIIVPGLEAVHDYQFSVLTGDREDTLDAASPVRLCGFQMCMQEVVGLLINLRDNMLFRQKELEA